MEYCIVRTPETAPVVPGSDEDIVIPVTSSIALYSVTTRQTAIVAVILYIMQKAQDKELVYVIHHPRLSKGHDKPSLRIRRQ